MSTNTLTMVTDKLNQLGLQTLNNVHYQLSPEMLLKDTLRLQQGVLNNTGALVISTGKFTGRSPKDKFMVKDAITEKTVHWGDFNIPIEAKYFDGLYTKMLAYLNTKEEIWVRDCAACADATYRIRVRVVTENPWMNLFAYNMFLRPKINDLESFEPDWHVFAAPTFKADPAVDGTHAENFAIINFTKKIILIGGTGYTGEIKKGIFTILNYLMPKEKGILSMHCSANMDDKGNTAIFFGLSGTGKTTLSADPNRKLIGDDEHGWTDTNVFNFEGGCYAKCIDLSEENEPEIYHAIKPGALVENTCFFKGTNTIDFSNKSITENTRVSYPLHYISNAIEPSIGSIPNHIFFLTCDAYGVLPPIAKLTPGQAMYQFISGYTAKVAGTEAGVTEPKSTFSACFGAPFMPLHPGEYAHMLGDKMKKHKVKVWLINTGWTGGSYGIGNRMKLPFTRAMITAALNGSLEQVTYEEHPIFGVAIPTTCPNVPSDILNPRNTWSDKTAYDNKAKQLAKEFIKNFEKYASGVTKEVLDAAPKA